MIGLAYFARVEALFSYWVFFLITGVEISIFKRLGVGATVGAGGPEAVRAQTFGALLVFTLSALWMARGHVAGAVRKAIRPERQPDDSRELLSYRTAFVGLVVGALYTLGWFHAAGIELKVLLLNFTLVGITCVGLSRIVAEMGLPYVNTGDSGIYWTGNYLFGSRYIVPSTLASNGILYGFYSVTQGFLGPPFAQTLKLVTDIPYSRKRLVAGILLALVLGFAISVLHTVYLGYAHGGYNLGAWNIIYGPQFAYRNGVSWILNPEGPNLGHLTFTVSGAAIAAVLTYLNHRFIWWPLLPVGLAVQGMSMARRIVFAVFATWAYKTLILKIGGVGLYRRGQPFFIGLVLGYAAAVFLSTVMDHFLFWGNGHPVHDY